MTAAAFVFAGTLFAQTHAVAATSPVTRAVGVYEWTGDLAKPNAARLIPVSLFIENQFQDGGSYYARPIPLALLNGNIYSLEKAGIPQGNVTLDFARHLQTATAGGADNTTDLGWFGYGTFAPLPAAKPPAQLRVSKTPPAIVSSKHPNEGADADADRPTFNKRPSDSRSTKNDPDRASVTPVPTKTDDDPDRPHLGKKSAPSDADNKPADTSADTPPASKTDTRASSRTSSDDDPDRPTLRHRDPKQAEADRKARNQSGVTAAPGSLNNDPDRPTMQRGKTAGIGGAPSQQLTGIPAGLHQTVAVSDATTREPHPFAREWASPTERAEVLAKLEAMAQKQLTEYDRANGLAAPSATAKPAASKSARAHRPVPPAPTAPAPTLTDETLSPYTLSYGGLPTFVYTAISPAPPTTSASGITLPERYITLTAQQVPSGELQLALASVTDANHLDRTPWMRLIDAVDPDASHRASLLFELRAHSSRQFALYRILSAKADQIFITHTND